MKHIVCYSGGHSSGLVAIEVTRRYGKENVILLNHDINKWVEDVDVKRFKKEVANYLQLPITYKNYNDLPLDEIPNQFEVCEKLGSFVNPATRQALCTTKLKTEPFSVYLKTYFPEKDCIIYYGFDQSEPSRIERREGILSDLGYKSDYPLALWSKEGIDFYNQFQIHTAMLTYKQTSNDNHAGSYLDNAIGFGLITLKSYDKIYPKTISSTKEIEIEPPLTYDNFKHANCVGCLKGGKQHWYVVYCKRYDVYERAKESESRIGYSIIKGIFLKDLEEQFSKMKCVGIEPSEHIPHQKFWRDAKKYIQQIEEDQKPCECVI